MKKNYQLLRLILLGCGLLFFKESNAQSLYDPHKVIPPAPTTASLGAFGNYNISHYSGTPSISIPIFDVVTAAHSLNIMLNYHSKGMRPIESAGWVGLGWSLSAGGVISRTVQGKEDLWGQGYHVEDALPPSEDGLYFPTQNWEWDHLYFERIKDGEIDGDPDIYSYNFAGFSGKFVMGKAGDGSPIFMDKEKNLKIEYVPGPTNSGSDSWRITDPRGYIYYFGTMEKSFNYSWSSEYHEISQPRGLDVIGNSGGSAGANSAQTTGWYLDSIVSPNREKVNFFYANKGTSLSNTQLSERRYQVNSTAVGNLYNQCFGSLSLADVEKPLFMASKQSNMEMTLTKIECSTGSVEFNTTTRDDLEYSGNKPVKLSEIIIKNQQGDRLKRFVFDYSYFSTNCSQYTNVNCDYEKRLKLDQITEYGEYDNIKKPPYQFSYFMPEQFAPVYTKGIDYWGFNNGEHFNATLLPDINVVNNTIYQSFSGADRGPSQDPNSLLPGVLSSIIYPTGGKTDFEYELNKFLESTIVNQSTPKTYFLEASTDAPSSKTVTFQLTKTVSAHLTTIFRKWDINSNPTIPNNFEIAHLVNNGNATSYSFYNSGTTEEELDQALTLQQGTYTLTLYYHPDFYSSVSIDWAESSQVINNVLKSGGGLRIKSITNIDSDGDQVKKSYQYSSSQGSGAGLLLNPLSYHYFGSYGGSQTGFFSSEGVYYLCMMSNSIYDGGINTQDIIGYDQVTEVIGQNGEGGRTTYNFINIQGEPSEYPMYLEHDPCNGKPQSVINYSAAGLPLQRKDYYYDVKDRKELLGVKIFTHPKAIDCFDLRFYSIPSVWEVTSGEITTDYTSQGEVYTDADYYYENAEHKELTKKVIIVDGSTTLSTDYKYAADFKTIAPYSQMYAKHIWLPLVEQSEYRNSTHIQTLKTNYKDWGSNIFSPETVQGFTGADNPEIRLRYHQVDPFYGNVLSVSKENGPKECYLWSYKGQYPIAKIQHATYNQVETLLDASDIRSFSQLASPSEQDIASFLAPLISGLPEAHISSFMYEPSVGLSSSRDPKGLTTYYEYDGFQRLKSVKDADGNILKHIDYHYKDQP